MTVIFPSGCEAQAINLDIKNMKIDIFTGATSVRSNNIYTGISRYPTGKHEIIKIIHLHISEGRAALLLQAGQYCKPHGDVFYYG